MDNVRTTKGRRGRTISLHPDLSRLLKTLPRHADGLVLHDPSGAPLTYTVTRTTFLKGVIKPLSKRFPSPAGDVGFAPTRPHSFRHFFCSQALAVGATDGEVREWMVHRSSNMIVLCTHRRIGDSHRRMINISFLKDRPDVPAAV